MKAQGELPHPDLQTKRIPEIEELADAYVAVRDARQQLTPKEIKAKAELHDAMRRHGFTVGDTYPLDEENEVVLEAKEENVKVRKIKHEKDTAEAAE